MFIYLIWKLVNILILYHNIWTIWVDTDSELVLRLAPIRNHNPNDSDIRTFFYQYSSSNSNIRVVRLDILNYVVHTISIYDL